MIFLVKERRTAIQVSAASILYAVLHSALVKKGVKRTQTDRITWDVCLRKTRKKVPAQSTSHCQKGLNWGTKTVTTKILCSAKAGTVPYQTTSMSVCLVLHQAEAPQLSASLDKTTFTV